MNTNRDISNHLEACLADYYQGLKQEDYELIAKDLWTQKWLSLIQFYESNQRMNDGRTLFRKGAIKELKIDEGIITAKVSDNKIRPYKVRIELQQYTEDDWKKIIDRFAAKTSSLIALLNEQLPNTIETIFDDCGLSLFPNFSEDIIAGCNCPDWTNPCRHTAAVFYFIAFLVSRYPLIILYFRGKKNAELLEMILESRRRESADRIQLQKDYKPRSDGSLSTEIKSDSDFSSFWGEKNRIISDFSLINNNKQKEDISYETFAGLNVDTIDLAKLLIQAYNKATEQIDKLAKQTGKNH